MPHSNLPHKVLVGASQYVDRPGSRNSPRPISPSRAIIRACGGERAAHLDYLKNVFEQRAIVESLQ